MKELNGIVSTSITKMIEDGSVEKMIQEKLKETIKDCIDSSMRSYGTFGTIIKEKIEESLKLSTRNISIPEYNKFIQSIISDQFGKILKENAVDHLQKLVNDIVKPVEKEAKFSNVIEKVQELWTDEAREHGKDEIAVEVSYNDEDTAIYVTFHHPEYDFYDVKVTFYNFNKKKDTWHIGYINEDSSVITKRPTCIARSTHSVTDMLFAYYAMGTEFEADEEFCNIQLNEY